MEPKLFRRSQVICVSTYFPVESVEAMGFHCRPVKDSPEIFDI